MTRLIISLVLLITLIAWLPYWSFAQEESTEPGVYTFAPFGEWKHFSPTNAPKDFKITDIAAVKDEIFAVGSDGGLYRVTEEGIDRLGREGGTRFTVVWGRSPTEVYAGGDHGVVCLYDGKTLRRLGTPIQTVKRRYHPEVEPRDKPVGLTHLWASSPRDVYAVGATGVLLHFDGKEWKEIGFGEIEGIFPDSTRLGRHVAHARFGPIWGDDKGHVWVAKRELPKDKHYRIRERALSEQEREERTFDLSIWQRKGDSWKKLDAVLTSESYSRVGRSPYWPEVIQAGGGYFTRFDNTLHRWAKKQWKSVTSLPTIPREQHWTHWTACAKNEFLVTGYGWEFYDGDRWIDISPVGRPELRGSVDKMVMTNDHRLAILAYARPNTIHVTRLLLDKIRSVPRPKKDESKDN